MLLPCRLKRLLNRAPVYLRKRLYHREFAEDWVDEYGRMIVMSEAAYPIWVKRLVYSMSAHVDLFFFPIHIHIFFQSFCIQGCSMPTEDAAVLTTLFTHLKSEEQISSFAHAFQEIREPRAQSIFTKETRAFGTFWVPPGPVRDARDEALMKMLKQGHKGWDEAKFLWEWEEICDVFAYHGREAAESWWVVWGVLWERSQEKPNATFH